MARVKNLLRRIGKIFVPLSSAVEIDGKQYGPELIREMAGSTAKRLRTAAYLAVATQIANIILCIFTNYNKQYNTPSAVICAAILASSLGFILLTKPTGPESHRLQKSIGLINRAYMYTFVALALVLSYFEYRLTGTYINYVILCVAVTLLPLFGALETIAYSTAVTLVYWYFTDFNSPWLLAMILSLFLILSQILGHTFIVMFETRKRLELANILLREQSDTDPLTGALNRRGLLTRATWAWDQCSRTEQNCIIIMIDVDNFKQYNDVHGHVEGDRCLQRVVSCMHQHAQRGSDIIARYGGDEFVIMLTGEKPAAALGIARDIKRGVEDFGLFAGGEPPLRVTLSIGIAGTPGTRETSYKQLLQAADDALYTAKRTQRNCIVYDNVVYT